MWCSVFGAVRFSDVLNPKLMIPFDMKAVVRLAKVTPTQKLLQPVLVIQGLVQ